MEEQINTHTQLTNIENEIWKDIHGYEGLYKISNLGRIKKLENAYKNKKLYNSNSFVKSHLSNKKNSYYRVSLIKDGQYRQWLIHRLLALTFISNPDNFPCVNHKNLIKTDNRLENLEWVTHKQNSQHAASAGKFISGENHHATHLNKEKVDLIRLTYLSGNKRLEEIYTLYNITSSTFHSIINNETWKDEEYNFIVNSNLFQKIKWLKYNRGSANGNGKLNDEKVKTIRELYEHWDYSSIKLARLFDVKKSTILSIIHKKTWKHI